MRIQLKYALGKKTSHYVFDFGHDNVSARTLCGLPTNRITRVFANVPGGAHVCHNCIAAARSDKVGARYVGALARAVLPQVDGIEHYVQRSVEDAIRDLR